MLVSYNVSILDQYRKEISMLNSRLQSADARQEDLAMLGQEATKPLLRQIDALQNQYNSAIIEWEKLEKRYSTISILYPFADSWIVFDQPNIKDTWLWSQ